MSKISTGRLRQLTRVIETPAESVSWFWAQIWHFEGLWVCTPTFSDVAIRFRLTYSSSRGSFNKSSGFGNCKLLLTLYHIPSASTGDLWKTSLPAKPLPWTQENLPVHRGVNSMVFRLARMFSVFWGWVILRGLNRNGKCSLGNRALSSPQKHNAWKDAINSNFQA